MNTIQELVQATKLTLDVDNPCGGNHGLNHTLVVMVYNRVADFDRRKVLRSTFGGAMKLNPKTSFYFIVAKQSDPM